MSVDPARPEADVAASGERSIAVGRDAVGSIFVTGGTNQFFTGPYERLAEPYIEAGRRDGDSSPVRPITKDAYYVLGDNRARSCDSRVWGLVARDRLIGPRIATYWPWDRISIR